MQFSMTFMWWLLTWWVSLARVAGESESGCALGPDNIHVWTWAPIRSVSSQPWDDYDPVETAATSTNAGGTRIQTITVQNYRGSTYTSVMTFPTPYVRWPVDYTWLTTYERTDKSGGTRHYVSEGIATLHSNPQPTGSELMPSSLRNHDLGDDHVLVYTSWDIGWFRRYSELFPDQEPIQTCDHADTGSGTPAFAGFSKSDWFTVAATTTDDFRASAQDHAVRPTSTPTTGAVPSGPSETSMNGTPDNSGGPPSTATSSPTAVSSAGCRNQLRINSHYQAVLFFGFVIFWNLWRF